LWIVRPCSSYDKSIIDERLTSLEEPFKSVGAGYYMDGGSVGIEIVDKNDTTLKIALPVIDFGDNRSYEEIFFGACHHNNLEDGSIEVKNPAETKLMLQDILHRYSNNDQRIDIALCAIRGRAVDYIRLIYHNMMGHYNITPSDIQSNEAENKNLIDYVSLYNKESQPQDYNEVNNAASHYQKAIDLYVERPEGISRNDMRIWPNKLTEEKREMLKEWVKQNEPALKHLIIGTKKPYFWKENISPKGPVLAILRSDLHIMRDLMYLLCCRAKIKAIEGDMKGATEDLVANFQFGNHLIGPKTMVEQMLGVSFQKQVIKAVLMIIDIMKPSIEERELLHNSLRKLTNNYNFEPDLLITKFIGLDCLQRAYLIDEDGSRVLDERELRKQLAMLNLQGQAMMFMLDGASGGEYCEAEIAEISYSDAEKLILEGIEKLEQVILLKAWQIKKLINDERSVLQEIQKSHPLLNSLAIQAINIKFSVYEQMRLQICGMEIIMAVLEFQENTGKLPADLDQLQNARLLPEIPIDPFTDKEMNYKRQGAGFTVYSDGLDFRYVEKRKPRMPGQDFQDSNLTVWPVIKRGSRKR